MAHLQRSKGCGLDVRLTCSDTGALQSLVDHCTRWRTVYIRMGADMLPILEPVHGNVPMLRYLEYTGCPVGTGSGFCRALETAPRLSSAVIRGKASLLRLPWAQLTKLCQRIPNLNALSRLGFARNLVELSLTNLLSTQLSLARARGLSKSSVLELPCLRMLYVDDGEFLDFLRLPMLEDIFVNQNLPSLISLIDRSSCSLRRITSDDSQYEEVVPILNHAPNLLEIRFAYNDSDVESLISHLTVPSQPGGDLQPPCPELISISLCFSVTDSERLSSLLVQMFESRLHSTACSNLSSCTIFDWFSKTDDRSAARVVQRLRDLGTDAKWLPERSVIDKDPTPEWRNGYP
ncbi:hypothetical protein DFH06DRAFT_1143262 [Mycena polygramma]|nr:hypothetical protein DFH06DRAFT_1143262 [Mycena polygramma]